MCIVNHDAHQFGRKAMEYFEIVRGQTQVARKITSNGY